MKHFIKLLKYNHYIHYQAISGLPIAWLYAKLTYETMSQSQPKLCSYKFRLKEMLGIFKTACLYFKARIVIDCCWLLMYSIYYSNVSSIIYVDSTYIHTYVTNLLMHRLCQCKCSMCLKLSAKNFVKIIVVYLPNELKYYVKVV